MASAQEIFEAELARRGVRFTRGEQPLQYLIEVGGLEADISLDNLAREYQRDRDAAAVAAFVERIFAAAQRTTPKWNPAYVYWSAESADLELQDVVCERITDTLQRVLVLSDAEQSRVTYVSRQMLKGWNVVEADATSLAATNLSSLLRDTQVEVAEVKGCSLGMVPLESPFKASVIFASTFKQFAEPALGWPVFAFIPCRDFVYLLGEKDAELIGSLGAVVQREFRNSGYPISTEVFRISDDGIDAIGKFEE